MFSVKGSVCLASPFVWQQSGAVLILAGQAASVRAYRRHSTLQRQFEFNRRRCKLGEIDLCFLTS